MSYNFFVKNVLCILCIAIIIFCLCGCRSESNNFKPSYLEKSTESEQDNLEFVVINEDSDEDIKKDSSECCGVTYILNTNSHKIHKLTCGTGDLIIPENRKVYKGDIEDLYNQGYTKCGNCFRGEK